MATFSQCRHTILMTADLLPIISAVPLCQIQWFFCFVFLLAQSLYQIKIDWRKNVDAFELKVTRATH